MNIILNIPNLLRFKLCALIVLIDFDYDRLCIAHYEIERDHLALWLEDAHDMINSLASCLKLEIPLENLAAVISPDEVLVEHRFDTRSKRPVYSAAPKFVSQAVDWFTKAAPREQRRSILEILLTSMMSHVMDDRKIDIYA